VRSKKGSSPARSTSLITPLPDQLWGGLLLEMSSSVYRVVRREVSAACVEVQPARE